MCIYIYIYHKMTCMDGDIACHKSTRIMIRTRWQFCILHLSLPPKKETLESWKVYGKHHRTTILVPHVSASFWGLLCRKPYFSDRKHDGFPGFFLYGISHASPLRSFPVVIIICWEIPETRLMTPGQLAIPQATRRVPFLPALKAAIQRIFTHRRGWPIGTIIPGSQCQSLPEFRVYKGGTKNGPMEQLTKTVKHSKRAIRTKSAEDSLFRLIFQKNVLGQPRCTNVIKHCTRAVKRVSLGR